MGRPVYREHFRRRLLEDGKALRGDVVKTVRGRRRLEDYGVAVGADESTIRRWEREGAGLTQALAMAAVEFDQGDYRLGAFVLDMIGETARVAPSWRPEPSLRR